MKKLISVVGPTGVGKTAFATSLAAKIHGALLSADSVQVYRGLDIISGKDIPKGSIFNVQGSSFAKSSYSFGFYQFENDVPVYLLDLVDPSYSFSVQDFVTCFRTVLPIVEEKCTPILVGGTGFYIDALFQQKETLSIPPNEPLRKELEQKSIEELQHILREENPEKFESMNHSDRNNKRRLVRAIEVASFKSEILNSEFETNSNNQNSKHFENLDLKDSSIVSNFGFHASDLQNLKIGLTASRDEIKKRISARVEKRIQDGAVEEAKELFKNYEHLSSGVKNANGYKQLFSYVAGELSFTDAVDAWRRSEFLNAKKQMTWFYRDPDILWFDITQPDSLKNAEEIAMSWYNKISV